MAKTTSLNKGEKTLLLIVGSVAALLLGILIWRCILDYTPAIALPPAPMLPLANALDCYNSAADAIADVQVILPAYRNSRPFRLIDAESLYRSGASRLPEKNTLDTSGQPMPSWQLADTNVQSLAPALASLQQGFALPYHTSRCAPPHSELITMINSTNSQSRWRSPGM